MFEYNKATNRLTINIFGLQIKISTKKTPKDINDYFPNLLYELADPRTWEHVKLPKVLGIEDSINEILNSNKSLARYGDGEFKLLNNENISFQKADCVLAKRLQEILANDNENLLVCLPDVFGYSERPYYKKIMSVFRESLYKYINFSKFYGNTIITRISDFDSDDEGRAYFDKFKKIWDNKDILIIEGFGSRLGVGNDLFNNAMSIERILCPIKNAFSKYSEILESIKKHPADKLILMALGPTATVLADDLSKLGYRALDVGHIDTMYEWFLRKDHCSIEGKIVFNSERSMSKLKPCKDKDYNNQIVDKING